MKKNILLLVSLLMLAVSGTAQVTEKCDDPVVVNGHATVTFKRYVVTLLRGKFSVGDGLQVRFSQGNLQYRAESDTWRFAENQWDYLGNTGGNATEQAKRADQANWIDLFGWGTSGQEVINEGANPHFQPWDVSGVREDYKPGNRLSVNIAQGSGYEEADWAYHNKIQNAGNAVHQWWCLSQQQWTFLLNTRDNAASLKGEGTVHGKNGLILLPDDWSWADSEVATAVETAGFTWTAGNSAWANVIPDDLWTILEKHGAVFLPAAGYRSGVAMYNIGSYGYYWTSTRQDTGWGSAASLRIQSNNVYHSNDNRNSGYSVRPVQEY